MKKFLAILVAVMILAASMSAMAAVTSADASVTISDSNLKKVHTYKVYQVFKADSYDTETQQLQNLKYGKNAASGTEGQAVSQADMEALTTIAGTAYANDQAKIVDLLPYVDITGDAFDTFTDSKTLDLPVGYYVIVDETAGDTDPDSLSLYMFVVSGETLTVSAKASTVESEKKVTDKNDTAGTTEGPQDSADYEIGDDIPYTLSFTLPERFADFEHYYVKFKDTMSKGLTYNGDAKLYVNETEIGAITMTSAAADNDGTLLTYEMIDIVANKVAPYANTTFAAGDKIVIKYTAHLNNNAVIGAAGNPNTFKVEYTRNPNDAGDGTKKPDETNETPDDTNIVFTYETIFDKVDSDNKPLTGANFTLYKKVGSEWVDVTTLGTESAHPIKGDVTSATTQFTFSGLDDGEYKLVETTIPAGYNEIAPIQFEIVANHVRVSDNPTLESLSGTATSDQPITFQVSKSDGTLTTSIVNQSGVVLPSTGGIGTTIFYVAGSILVLAAAILLVTKRRMGNND